MIIPEAFQIALQRHQAGRLAEAEGLYRQILAAQPDHSDAWHLLGVIAQQGGRHDLAVEWIGRAIGLDPINPAAHCNLGEALRMMGRRQEAIPAFHRALELKPDYPEAHNNLGSALRDLGRMDDAIAAYRCAVAFKPAFPEAHVNLGDALREQGHLDQAIAALRHAIELKPELPEAHNNLGVALRDQGRLDEAVAAHRRAITLKPGYLEAYNNLGAALAAKSDLDESISAFRQALRINPEHAGLHSNLIYALHFHPSHTGRTIGEEQRRWNRQFSEPLKQFALPHANDRNPERRLRIGYVSSAFWDHVVGRHLLQLFEHHDRASFEIVCYSGGARSDKITEGFRKHTRHWRNTVGMSDRALAELIRLDGVDILVDLTQHLEGNRLPMFARQPAPVQVSFAGYPDTTGLDAIEHRISDRYLEAGAADENAGRNERVCLIDSFWCYDPCGAKLEFNELPAREGGGVTFGCLNNFCKANEGLLKLWARVLVKVSGSRLVLLSGIGSHRQRTLEVFEKEGVDASRVEFVEFRPRQRYLELYHRLDIVLDTFPYNGHTTSLDALWMGVPVVSLAGGPRVSRAGLSQLTNLGLPELIGHSEADYVHIAEKLAGDLPRLARLRSSLRDRMEKSVLMDAPRFARQMEQAYREMWRAWCARKSPAIE